jgi:hypothetical protein
VGLWLFLGPVALTPARLRASEAQRQREHQSDQEQGVEAEMGKRKLEIRKLKVEIGKWK